PAENLVTSNSLCLVRRRNFPVQTSGSLAFPAIAPGRCFTPRPSRSTFSGAKVASDVFPRCCDGNFGLPGAVGSSSTADTHPHRYDHANRYTHSDSFRQSNADSEHYSHSERDADAIDYANSQHNADSKHHAHAEYYPYPESFGQPQPNPEW